MASRTTYFDSDTVADPRSLRAAFGHFATGVTVITTRSVSGKFEGFTANSFASLSLDPPMVLWSLRDIAPSFAAFAESGAFAVNILSADQRSLSQHFATPAADKFENIDFEAGLNGCPLLDGALATFECATERLVPGGDHTIFLGRVFRATCREGTSADL